MTTSRFDQKVDVPYGTCETCGEELATQSLTREHTASTFDEAKKLGRDRGHTVLITNQTREGRIENAVEGLVDEAITDVIDALEALIVARDITRKEATGALDRWSDFADGWRDARGDL